MTTLQRWLSLSTACGLGLVGLAAGVPSTVSAQVADEGVWSVTPRITVGQTFTDNVNLASRGRDSTDVVTSEFITEISPGVDVTRNTRRLSLNLNYTLRNRGNWRYSSRSTNAHLLSANSTTEVVRDTLFLDASASRSEQAFSLLQPVGIGTDVGEQRFSDVTRWSVGPRFQQRLGTAAVLSSAYSVNGVYYSGSNAPEDTLGQQGSVQLASGPQFTLVDWALRGSGRRENFRNFDDDVTFYDASATVGLNPTNKLRVFATGGREWNDFDSAFARDDGKFWNAGASFAFTRRTNVEASYGERFFGATRSLAVNQRNRRTTFRAQRSQSVVTSSTPGLTQTGVLGDFVDFGDFNCDVDPTSPECQLALVPVVDQVLFERVFVVDTTLVSMALNLPKTTWTLVGSVSERERRSAARQDIDPGLGRTDDSKVQSLQGQVRYRWSPRTNVALSLRYADTEFRELDRDDQLYSGQLAFNRRFGSNTNGSLTFRHQRRESSEDNADYRENAVIARATFLF